MPVFKYQAMDPKGAELDDTIEADNADDAVQKIRSKGLFLLKIREQHKKPRETALNRIRVRKADLDRATDVFARMKGRVIRLCQFCHDTIGLTDKFEFKTKGRVFSCTPVQPDVWHSGCFQCATKVRRWLVFSSLIGKDFPESITTVGGATLMEAHDIAFIATNWVYIEATAVSVAENAQIDVEDQDGDCRRRLLQAADGLDKRTVIDGLLTREA
jgi:hypothetical protein